MTFSLFFDNLFMGIILLLLFFGPSKPLRIIPFF